MTVANTRKRRIVMGMALIHSHDAVSEAEAVYRRTHLTRGGQGDTSRHSYDDFFKIRRRYVSSVGDVAPVRMQRCEVRKRHPFLVETEYVYNRKNRENGTEWNGIRTKGDGSL